LGTLETSNWTVLETSLGIGTRQPLYSLPLTLVSLRVHETGAARKLQAGSILIDSIITSTSNALGCYADGFCHEAQIVEPFDFGNSPSSINKSNSSPNLFTISSGLFSGGSPWRFTDVVVMGKPNLSHRSGPKE